MNSNDPLFDLEERRKLYADKSKQWAQIQHLIETQDVKQLRENTRSLLRSYKRSFGNRHFHDDASRLCDLPCARKKKNRKKMSKRKAQQEPMSLQGPSVPTRGRKLQKMQVEPIGWREAEETANETVWQHSKKNVAKSTSGSRENNRTSDQEVHFSAQRGIETE